MTGAAEKKETAAQRFFATILAGRKARADMAVLRLPLHLAPEDYSPEAANKRYDLHVKMSSLNPRGWRTPPRNRRRNHPETRLETLAKLAQAGGPA